MSSLVNIFPEASAFVYGCLINVGYEQQDAKLFAFGEILSIGVDYLKYDNCGRTKPEWKPRYDRMRDALVKY